MLHGIGDNPVVTKEFRGRMRGTRTYWLLFGYLLLLSLILFFSYLGWWNSHSNTMETGGASAGFTVGRDFFKILFYSQAVMIALITPALTAGAISVEREQRTFELLRGTILRPGAIVWGKLLSSVSFVALLLTSSLPLVSLCFLLGGVSPGEVFFAYLLLIADAFLFGAIGLCWSAYAANTATATVLSYGTLILFFVATAPFAAVSLFNNGNNASYGLCAVNPVGAVTGAILPEHYYGWTLPAWIPALILNGTLTALLILAAVNRLEDFPTRRAAPLRLVALLFAGLLIFFGNGVVLGSPVGFGMLASVQLMLRLVIASVVLLLFVPVLVTGDLQEWWNSSQRKKRAWSPGRVFSEATLRMGLPLALLLAVIVLGLTFAAGHIGSPSAPRSSFVAPQGFVSPPLGSIPRPVILPTGSLPWQAAVMLLLIVVGIGGLGFLLSTLLNNRWASLTLLYLALLLAVALPFFSYATLYGQDAAVAARNPAVNTLYLCPFVPLWQMTDVFDPRPSFGRNSAVSGMIGYGSYPLWVGTSIVYLTIGLISYAAAFAILRRKPTPLA